MLFSRSFSIIQVENYGRLKSSKKLGEMDRLCTIALPDANSSLLH